MSTDTQATHLTITRPDDWHLHVRDGDALATVVPLTVVPRGVFVPLPAAPSFKTPALTVVLPV